MANKLTIAQYNVECLFCETEIELEEDKHIALHSIICPRCGLEFTVIFECKITTMAHANEEDLDESREHSIKEETENIIRRHAK